MTDNRYNFKAILKTEQGEIAADGTGTIDVASREVTFKSSFVPLYPIGTPMEVVRIHNEAEVHRFLGKVYLSDKKLMRLVSVEDELLPGSEDCYYDNMDFPATVIPKFAQESGGKGFFKKAKPSFLQPRYEAKIIELTTHHLTFMFENNPEFQKGGTPWGQSNPASEMEEETGLCFEITAKSPLPLNHAMIQVIEPFYFGERPSYKCSITEQTSEKFIKLHEFLWEYNLSHNKLF